jgi:hypothetical protein
MSLFFDLSQEQVTPPIPGLIYIPDFVSPEEEADLISAIDAEPWDTTWKRRRQPY